MCLIAFATKDRSQVPNKLLEIAHDNNSDGWGIMFPQNGVVTYQKAGGIEGGSHPAFMRAWRDAPLRTPIAAHFRFATAGACNKDMAHPFEVIAPERGEVQARGPRDELATRQSCAPAARGVDDA